MRTTLAEPDVCADLDPLLEALLARIRPSLSTHPCLKYARRQLGVDLKAAMAYVLDLAMDDIYFRVLIYGTDIFRKALPEKLRDVELKNKDDFVKNLKESVVLDACHEIGLLTIEQHDRLKTALAIRHRYSPAHAGFLEPTPLKFAAFVEDCVVGTLERDLPEPAIDVDVELRNLAGELLDERSTTAVLEKLAQAPHVRREAFWMKAYSQIVDPTSGTTILTQNLYTLAARAAEVFPIPLRVQIARRVEQERDSVRSARALQFLIHFGGIAYLSIRYRTALFTEVLKKLEANLKQWAEEDACVDVLTGYDTNLPASVKASYVELLTLVYIGEYRFTRGRVWYAWHASHKIEELFGQFDNEMAGHFVGLLKSSARVRDRMDDESVGRRFAALGAVLLKAERPAELRGWLEWIAQAPGQDIVKEATS